MPFLIIGAAVSLFWYVPAVIRDSTNLWWLAIGAVAGCGIFAWSLFQRPVAGDYYGQAFGCMGALGALLFGPLLWWITRLFV